MPPSESQGPQLPRDIWATPEEDPRVAPTLPTAPQPACSLTQVREADCWAFTRRAAQGDMELLANLPDQRVALRHAALACLVGTMGGPGQGGWAGSGAGLVLTCYAAGSAPPAAQRL